MVTSLLTSVRMTSGLFNNTLSIGDNSASTARLHYNPQIRIIKQFVRSKSGETISFSHFKSENDLEFDEKSAYISALSRR